ncbi:hypothetical protein RIF29_23381 [Crotalaria pallida]|uniref:C2H2-type domain-containing protein n=1 Tax=Crotalaria pallida TaxID=3830 RepID=A0AAN9I8K3_CROPI
MELSYTAEEESSKNSSSSEETDDNMGTGRRSYECVYCKRGFTTAQALGGHMNIHRKDRVVNNSHKAKSNYHRPSSSSTKVVDDSYDAQDLLGFYSPPISTHLVAAGVGNSNINNYYCYPTTTTTTYPDHHEVDTNNSYHHHQFYFPSQACGTTRPFSHIENQRDRRDLFGQDYWKQNLSLFSKPNKIEDNNSSSEEGGLDLELKLGHYP